MHNSGTASVSCQLSLEEGVTTKEHLTFLQLEVGWEQDQTVDCSLLVSFSEVFAFNLGISTVIPCIS